MKSKHTHSNTTARRYTLFFGTIAFLLVVLMLFLTQRSGPGSDTHSTNTPVAQQDNRGENTDRQSTRNTPPTTTTGNQESTDSATTDRTYESAEVLRCAAETGEVCTIKASDPIYEAIGHDPTEAFTIGGRRVTPSKITYQLTYGTYDDEQIRDNAGKVLSSSLKVYNAQTNVLNISIGANPDYVQGLPFNQKRSLYVAQTIRTFLTMFQESAENYQQVERSLSVLGSWQPTP